MHVMTATGSSCLAAVQFILPSGSGSDEVQVSLEEDLSTIKCETILNDTLTNALRTNKSLELEMSDTPALGEDSAKTAQAPPSAEQQIALSQLEELEMAIKTLKTTRGDGRRLRWAEHRARKSIAEGQVPPSGQKSPGKNDKENSITENGVTNNNNNDATPKLEPVGEANNVLESMKMQFLQGTENILAVNPEVITKTTPPVTKQKKICRVVRLKLTPNISLSNSTNDVSDQSLECPSVTKGLREVRKSENDSDDTDTKENLNDLVAVNGNLGECSLAMADQLIKTAKCPLITATAKILSRKQSKESSKAGLSESAKGNLKPTGKSKTTQEEKLHDPAGPKQRKRGISSKFALPPEVLDSVVVTKMEETIVVDVHNAMNGEPQSVVKTSILNQHDENIKKCLGSPVAPLPELASIVKIPKPSGKAKIIKKDTAVTKNRLVKLVPVTSNQHSGVKGVVGKAVVAKKNKYLLHKKVTFPCRKVNKSYQLSLTSKTRSDGPKSGASSLTKVASVHTVEDADKIYTQNPIPKVRGQIRKGNFPAGVGHLSAPAAKKVKGKIPRFLKQLFQDEGVQNMLRSIEVEGSTDGSSEISVHKLRPKRHSEPLIMSDSETESLTSPAAKKKKPRGSELDTLYMDEGALNLLTSIEPGSRRGLCDDNASDVSLSSHSSSIKSLRVSGRGFKGVAGTEFSQENRKRKHSDSSIVSTTSAKSASLLDGKRVCTDSESRVIGDEPENYVNSGSGQQSDVPYEMSPSSKYTKSGRMQLIVSKSKPVGGGINYAVLQDELKRTEEAFVNGQPLNNKQKQTSHADEFIAPKFLKSGVPVVKCNSLSATTQQSSHEKLVQIEAKADDDDGAEMHEHPALPGQGEVRYKGNRPAEAVRQSQRAIVRQNEVSIGYRDIVVRKFSGVMQIILSPTTTKMKNAMNSRVLRELCEAFGSARRDESVRMVLLTSTGTTFCQGVDLTCFVTPNFELRKKNVDNVVRGIRDFVKCLVQFPKPVVAGVDGNAIGLGVAMLPLFDLVIASDRAEFYMPYSQLGQVPEGGATFTFPNILGKLQATNLFLGTKVTAGEAKQLGLASETLWPATFHQELIARVTSLASNSAQSMEATKALMNHHLITRLQLSLESECRLLMQHWMTAQFTGRCQQFLEQYDELQFQKPVTFSS